MKICSKGHDEICYNVDDCPVCKTSKMIDGMVKEIEYLHKLVALQKHTQKKGHSNGKAK
jgi:hypothetical protein